MDAEQCEAGWGGRAPLIALNPPTALSSMHHYRRFTGRGLPKVTSTIQIPTHSCLRASLD